MAQSRGSRAAMLLATLGTIAGCVSPEVSDICYVPPEERTGNGNQNPCLCTARYSQEAFDFDRRPQLDLLLVIGNTRGMLAKQLLAIDAVRRFTELLESTAVDYHIAVISTDVGSWVNKDTPWTMSSGACDSYEGDDGRLQARSCLDRAELSAEAAAACASVCPDRRYLPADGRPFIAREQGVSNVPPVLDAKTGLPMASGDPYAVGCMMLLGEGGCGVSSPLESARRAIDQHLAENSLFLRRSAVFTMLLLTDQDDCSMQLARRGENDPRTQNCTTPDRNAAASCYQLGAYRCLARDLECDQPMNGTGSKTGCRERADTPLESTEKYAHFFRTLISLDRLTVAGIWTLPPLDKGGKLAVTQNPNALGSAGLEPARGADAGCQSSTDPALTGSAQLRLSKFFSQLLGESAFPEQSPRPRSICAPSEYVESLWNTLGDVAAKQKSYCLPDVPLKWSNGNPRCVAGYVPYEMPQAGPRSYLPLCGPSCCEGFANSKEPTTKKDPQLARDCANEIEDCYCVVQSKVGECRGDYQSGYVVGHYRKGNRDGPYGLQLSVRCAAECRDAVSTRTVQ